MMNLFKKNSDNMSLAQIKMLKLGDDTIEYCSFGSGDPIILIMGYAATFNGWDVIFIKELAKSYQVIIFNNRNTGNSKFNSDANMVCELANDVEAMRNELNLGKIIVCGISMGGIIAQKYACLYPDKISHLILINTFPPGDLVIKPDLNVETVLRDLQHGGYINYWRMLRLLFPSIILLFRLWLFHFSPKGSRNIVPKNTIISQQNVLEDWGKHLKPESVLNRITAPTLILCGLKDQIVPPENSQILYKHIKNSKLNNFPIGGHVLIFQYPITLAKRILDFIHKHS